MKCAACGYEKTDDFLDEDKDDFIEITGAGYRFSGFRANEQVNGTHCTRLLACPICGTVKMEVSGDE